MPSIRQIPARIEKLCEPCEYHKRINAFYGHSHSWADYNCMHPDAFEEIPPLADPEKEKIRLKLLEDAQKYGRHIGRTELQPDFCPLERKDEAGNNKQ